MMKWWLILDQIMERLEELTQLVKEIKKMDEWIISDALSLFNSRV